MTHFQAIGLVTTILLTTAVMASKSTPPTEDNPLDQKRSESFQELDRYRIAHGIIMSISFVILLPAFALTLYLVPYSKVASRIHAPLQLLTVCLIIAGFGLGIDVEINFDLQGQYHPKIGIAVVVYLIVVQPLMGFLQHRWFKKHAERGASSIFGHVHRWLGRAVILLGIINGGLGLQLARDLAGDAGATTGTEIAYGVVAGFVGLLWLVVVLVKKVFLKGRTIGDREKNSHTGETGVTSA
jgi:predicted Na+-dependent transporter